MLMVADHRGRITFSSSALTTFLGHETGTLANTTTTVGTLLPQPWAQLLFPQWLRDALQAGGGVRGVDGRANGNGAGGAGGPGGSGGRAGQFVQLVSCNKKLVLAKVNVSLLEVDDQVSLVVAVQKTTVEAGQDLRRLRVQVGPCFRGGQHA